MRRVTKDALIAFRANHRLKTALDRVAEDRGKSSSELIRELVEREVASAA